MKFVKCIALISAGVPAKRELIRPLAKKPNAKVYPEYERGEFCIVEGEEYEVVEHLTQEIKNINNGEITKPIFKPLKNKEK